VISEPTSLSKCRVLLPTLKKFTMSNKGIDFISPNVLELRELGRGIEDEGLMESPYWQDSIASFELDDKFFENLDEFCSSQTVDVTFLEKEEILPLSINLLPFIKNIIVKCGSKGIVIVSRSISSSSAFGPRTFVWKKGGIRISLYPPSTVIESKNVVNVTGAGDSFVGVLAAGLSQDPDALQNTIATELLIETAQKASLYSLQGTEAVSPRLSNLKLKATRGR